MKEEWDDMEREPRRIVQFFDPEAQNAYKNWPPKLKLEWLASIMKLYWAVRSQEKSSISVAAEPKQPYPER